MGLCTVAFVWYKEASAYYFIMYISMASYDTAVEPVR